MSLLTVDNVCKYFGRLLAVNQASLQVEQGQIIGLIGPNGSGKSTLLKLMTGALRPDAGAVTFAGAELTGLPPDAVFRQGLVRSYQDPSLFFRMTALDNSLLPVQEQRGENPFLAPFHRLWRGQEAANSQRAARLFDDVQLAHQYATPAADLSGGQMKLLELARSLMGDPKLLLLDEPTAGIAPNLAYTIFQEIARLRAELDLTFLIVEHRLEILFDFVDAVYVMHMGRVIAHGTPREIEQDALVREIYFGE